MKLLFVCLGNICRSPLAHAVCEKELQKREMASQVFVESSGTSSWHNGEQADSRMRRTATDFGIHIDHMSRKFTTGDFSRYDMIFAMDRDNYQTIMQFARSADDRRKVHMFRDFDPMGNGDVPDPYYGGPNGFHLVIEIVIRTCEQIVSHIIENE